MAYTFNGSTVTIGEAAQTPLLSCTFTNAAAEIDITGCADTVHTYEAGLPNLSCTFEIVGGTTLAIGDVAAVSVAWTNGVADAMTTGVVTNVETRGSLDDKITTSITMRPAS